MLNILSAQVMATFPPGLVKTVNGKAKFIKKRADFMITNFLSVGDMHRNVEYYRDEILEIDSDLEPFLDVKSDLCALNTGAMPPSNRKESNLVSPFSSRLYMLCVTAICKDILESVENKPDWENLFVRLKHSSNTGYNGPDIGYLDCTYDEGKKMMFLQNYKALFSSGVLGNGIMLIIGYRIQVDKKTKADSRPSFMIQMVKSDSGMGTVHNPYYGGRVRDVNVVPISANFAAVMQSALIMNAIPEYLKPVWKLTNESLNEFFTGKYSFCVDVSNNDRSFDQDLNFYISQCLSSTDVLDIWTKMVNSPIVGAYRTGDDNQVNYSITNPLQGDDNEGFFFGRLLSGEGLTSVKNKIAHTAKQMEVWFLTQGHTIDSKMSIDEVREIVNKPGCSFSTTQINNGDDISAGFDTAEERDLYKDIFLNKSPSIMVYEEEDPQQINGMGVTAGINSPCMGIESRLFSLLIRGLFQRERRDVDSPLGSLPYNSALGRIDHHLEWPGMHDVERACDVFLKILFKGEFEKEGIDPECGLDEKMLWLQAKADQELSILSQDPTNRQYAQQKLLDGLGIPAHKAHELLWKFTTEELMAVDADATVSLFLSERIGKFHDSIHELMGKSNLLTDSFMDSTIKEGLSTEGLSKYYVKPVGFYK